MLFSFGEARRRGVWSFISFLGRKGDAVSCAFLLFDICIAGTIQLFRAVLIMESVKGRVFIMGLGLRMTGGILNEREGGKIGGF